MQPIRRCAFARRLEFARRTLACALLVALGACGTAPEQRSPHGPRRVHELESWTLEQGGARVGHMRHLEIEEPGRAEGIRFYRVENPAGQWLGYVDSSGRVFRYSPFEVEEVFCGVYPMVEALALLFDAPPHAAAIEAVPVDAAAREASGDPRREGHDPR